MNELLDVVRNLYNKYKDDPDGLKTLVLYARDDLITLMEDYDERKKEKEELQDDMNEYVNTFFFEQPYKYFEDIRVENIPIKKWIHIVVRSTSQNIIDVYINGKLVKRQRLSNVIKQNYDNLYVNMNGGFDGFMSNIKYYNYAIGTLEIDNVVKNGPNLKMSKNNALNVSKPEYLSGDWYFSETMYNQ